MGAGAAGGSVFLSCCRIFASELLLGLSRGGPSWQPWCLITPCSHPLSSAPHLHIAAFPCPGSCCIFSNPQRNQIPGLIAQYLFIFHVGKGQRSLLDPTWPWDGCGMFQSGKRTICRPGHVCAVRMFSSINIPF